MANGQKLHRGWCSQACAWVCKSRSNRRRRQSSASCQAAFSTGGWPKNAVAKPVGDGDQITLDEVDEFVQAGLQHLVDRARAEDRAQLVESFGDIVAAADVVARFEVGERARPRCTQRSTERGKVGLNSRNAATRHGVRSLWWSGERRDSPRRSATAHATGRVDDVVTSVSRTRCNICCRAAASSGRRARYSGRAGKNTRPGRDRRCPR